MDSFCRLGIVICVMHIMFLSVFNALYVKFQWTAFPVLWYLLEPTLKTQVSKFQHNQHCWYQFKRFVWKFS